MHSFAPREASVPAQIFRLTGINPAFLVKSGRDTGLLAAKWRLPRMRIARDRSSQHVLAFHSRGRVTITRTLAGVCTTKVAAAGSISFTPADATVVSWIESPLESVHIYIERAALPELVEAIGPAMGRAPEFSGVRDPWLIGYFQMLVTECELLAHPEPLAESQFLSETEHLLLRHLRQRHFQRGADTWPDPGSEHVVRSEHVVHPLRPALLRRIEEYVEANLGDDVPLRTMAALVHMSIDHFVRTFRAAIGKTPHQYVLERRLERAALLLRDDAMSLGDIAHACGFRNPSHFSTRFRARFGMSPSHYRHAR